MTVAHLWSGAVTETTATVVAKTTASSARLVLSTDIALTSPRYVGPVTPANDGIIRFDVTGLTANTLYYYGVEEDGLSVDPFHGTFRTIVIGPWSFRFAASSCGGLTPTYPGSITGVTDTPAYGDLVEKNPLFMIHLGDLYYGDLILPVVNDYRTFYDAVPSQPNAKLMWSAIPVDYIWDDHDYGYNNSSRIAAGKPAAQQVYRERVPHYPLNSTTGAIWHTFVVGRVRFVVTDLRSDSDPRSDVDDVNKLMLGAEQEAWFKSTLLAAEEPVICWVSTLPWVHDGVTGADPSDSWGGFQTERQRLADWLDANGMLDRIFMIAGDNHALSFDAGGNNPWGGFPNYAVGALDSTPLTKGGPYDYTQAGRGQYGIFDVYDDGGAVVVITLTGYQYDAVWRQTVFSILPFTDIVDSGLTVHDSAGAVMPTFVAVPA